MLTHASGYGLLEHFVSNGTQEPVQNRRRHELDKAREAEGTQGIEHAAQHQRANHHCANHRGDGAVVGVRVGVLCCNNRRHLHKEEHRVNIYKKKVRERNRKHQINDSPGPTMPTKKREKRTPASPVTKPLPVNILRPTGTNSLK